MKLRSLVFLAALIPLVACAQGNGGAPQEGVDYQVIQNGQPLDAQPGRIEVAEVFGYGCIHCARLQPHINEWKRTLPEDVNFVYVPAAFGGPADNLARAFYAAEAAGVLDQTHDAMYAAVHTENRIRQASEDELASFYGEHGADEAQFRSTMKSFGVNAKINRAKQFMMRSGVDSTPQMIVNGRYRVMATTAGGFEGMLRTVDMLVERERQRDAN